MAVVRQLMENILLDFLMFVVFVSFLKLRVCRHHHFSFHINIYFGP